MQARPERAAFEAIKAGLGQEQNTWPGLCAHGPSAQCPCLSDEEHAPRPQAVFDELCRMLGADRTAFKPKKGEQSVIMFVGLQVRRAAAAQTAKT